MGDDPVPDQEGEGVLEEGLHPHVGLLLLLVDRFDDVVVWSDAVVFRLVIRSLLHLHQGVLLKLLLGERGEFVETVGGEAELEKGEGE